MAELTWLRPVRRGVLLAERILSASSTLEGECMQVTILFADIKGSTRLIEELDPEQANKLLDAVLQAMIDAVHCYEGTVRARWQATRLGGD